MVKPSGATPHQPLSRASASAPWHTQQVAVVGRRGYPVLGVERRRCVRVEDVSAELPQHHDEVHHHGLALVRPRRPESDDLELVTLAHRQPAPAVNQLRLGLRWAVLLEAGLAEQVTVVGRRPAVDVLAHRIQVAVVAGDLERGGVERLLRIDADAGEPRFQRLQMPSAALREK